MSKQFKNKTCAYCGQQPSTTADRVFSREFFLIARRANLPKVPACRQCNGEKSDLEHYLTAVLPFGGRHPDAQVNLADMVPRRLAKNASLHRRLNAGATRRWTRQGSVDVPAMTIPFDGEQLRKLFALIAKGLVWRHWGVLIGPDASVWAGILNRRGEDVFNYLFGLPAKARVKDSPGAGTFAYEGAQGSDIPQMTVWRFSIYGGAVVSGDPDAPFEHNSLVGAVTGSKQMMAKFIAIAEGEPAA